MASSDTVKAAEASASSDLPKSDQLGGKIGSANKPTRASSQTKYNRAIARLDYYRALDRATQLMQHALDLRERLTFGLDLGDMVDEVHRFKRAISVWRR